MATRGTTIHTPVGSDVSIRPGYHAARAAMDALDVKSLDEKYRRDGEFTAKEWSSATGRKDTATRVSLANRVDAGELLHREGVTEDGCPVIFFRLARPS